MCLNQSDGKIIKITKMHTANISEKLVKSYSDRTYLHTTMITHKGTLIAFAMDDQRRILYTVLDLNDTKEGKEEFDVAYWSDNPTELQFPSEIEQVGYSLVGANRMPTVKVNTRIEVANPSELMPEEVDRFLSTTARLTADAPFQVFSDNQHIFLFRQAIIDDHQDAVYKLKNGAVSGDTSRPDSDFVLQDGNKVPIVDCTLLGDRFLLSGKFLQPNREVRYQRSRHKTRPANQTDSLGAKDMEGNPFFEPTQELAFICNLQHGSFSVLQLPTQVQSIKRWQLFAHNSSTERIDSFNFEVSDDGLFNLQGTQLYTSPEPQYRTAVLERSPGACPFTSLPLVPVAQDTNYAETALEFDGSGDYVEVAAHANPTTAITVSLWAKSNTDNWNVTGCLASKRDAYILHPNKNSKTIRFYINSSGSWKKVEHTPLDLKQWHHYAGTFDGKTLKLYIDGEEVASNDAFTTTTAINNDSDSLYLGRDDGKSGCFNGQIDEVRVWNRALLQHEIDIQCSRRLIGNEPGLVGYWRFDEGSGNTVFDQTDNGNNGTIHGNPQWVASDAPVADHPGMRRSSFTFSGRSLVGGLSSRLYFQQEETASGYDGIPKPKKKNARVMLAAATTQTDGTDPATATLDLAVSKEGRLAQVPDTINLPVLEKPEASNDVTVMSSLEGEIRTLRDDIEQLDQEIVGLQINVARIPTETGIKQSLASQIATLQDQKVIEEGDFRNYWCKLVLTINDKFLVVERASAGWVYISPTSSNHGNRDLWGFSVNSDGSYYIYNKGRAGILVGGEPCHVLTGRTDATDVRMIPNTNDRIYLGRGTQYWYAWDSNKYGGVDLHREHQHAVLRVIKDSIYDSSKIDQIDNEIRQKQTELTIQTSLVNDLFAQQSTLSQKETLRLQKQANLNNKKDLLSQLTAGEKQEIRLPMGYVHQRSGKPRRFTAGILT